LFLVVGIVFSQESSAFWVNCSASSTNTPAATGSQDTAFHTGTNDALKSALDDRVQLKFNAELPHDKT
jgi:hypothetical protein